MKTDEKWHYSQFTQLLDLCNNLIDLLCNKNLSLDEKAESAKKIETAADSIVESVKNRLRDRKRFTGGTDEKVLLRKLALKIDDIADELEKAANRMKSYKVSLDEEGKKMLSLLAEAVEEAKLAFSCLGQKRKNFDKLEEHCERIKELESEADIVHRPAIEEITAGKDMAIKKALEDPSNLDAVVLIQKIDIANRRQEIIGIFESAFDQAQDVANLIEELRYEIE